MNRIVLRKYLNEESQRIVKDKGNLENIKKIAKNENRNTLKITNIGRPLEIIGIL